MQEATAYGLEKKLNTKDQRLELALISDYEATSVDKLAKTKIKGEAKINTDNETDLQKLYDFFVSKNLSPFYPEDRSIGRVKEAIYHFFKMCLGMKYTDHFSEIINIVLSPKNIQHFVNVIDSTKTKYIDQTNEQDIELKKSTDWELPELLNYGGNYQELKVEKSAMQPFYYDNKWKTETAFIECLEKSANLVWWFKNGDRDRIFFAVPYVEDNEPKPFYVDFIVRLKNGAICLFDTKSGRTIKDAREKSDGLQQYLKKQNKKGMNLFGGIITNSEPKNFSGRWMIYTNEGSKLKSNDFSNWQQLEI